jgi:hypothetical protein
MGAPRPCRGLRRTARQVAYDLAFKAAAEAHEAVMAPARAEYDAAIAAAKASKTMLTEADLAAWRDAYDRALATYRRVLAEHGFEGKGERVA